MLYSKYHTILLNSRLYSQYNKFHIISGCTHNFIHFFFTFQVVLTISCILLTISCNFLNNISHFTQNIIQFCYISNCTPNFIQFYYFSGCLEKNVAQYFSDNRGENVCGDRRNECGCYQITKI